MRNEFWPWPIFHLKPSAPVEAPLTRAAPRRCVLIELHGGKIRPSSTRRGTPRCRALLLLCFLLALGAMRSDLFPDLVRQPTAAHARGKPCPSRSSPARPDVRHRPQSKVAARPPTLALIADRPGIFVASLPCSSPSRSQWVSRYTRVAFFSLAPVFAVVFEPYIVSDDARLHTEGQPAPASLAGGARHAVVVLPRRFPLSLQAGARLCRSHRSRRVCRRGKLPCCARCARNRHPQLLLPWPPLPAASAAIGLAAASAFTQGLPSAWTALHSAPLWSAVIALPGFLLALLAHAAA